MKILPFTDSNISEAVDLLINNKVVILPTDTIYGLHLPVSRENMSILNRLKHRPARQPINALYGDVSQITGFTNNNGHIEIIKELATIPHTTIIIDSSIDDHGQAFRQIDQGSNPELFEVITATGPLFSTSANISGTEYVDDLDVICETFDGQVEYLFHVAPDKLTKGQDTFKNRGNLSSSTIIDIRNNELKLIRQGKTPFSDIKARYDLLTLNL